MQHARIIFLAFLGLGAVLRPLAVCAQPGGSPEPLPVIANAEFDPPVVTPGERSIYRLTVNALQSEVSWNSQIGVPPGLEFKPATTGQILTKEGNEQRPLTAMNFNARANQAGYYAVRMFALEVNGQPVIVPEAILQVAPEVDAAHRPARQLILQPDSTNVYFGETFSVITYLPAASNTVEALTPLEFIGNGFQESRNDFRQTVKIVELDGRKTTAYVGESRLTPIATGPQKLSVQAFTSGSQFYGRVTITAVTIRLGGKPNYTLVESEPVTIQVHPLPPPGKIFGFTGHIGNVTADPAQLSTNSLNVGDALTLSVTFRSDRDLTQLTPPLPPRSPDWDILPPVPVATTAGNVVTGQSSVTFSYTMIPLAADVHQTPAIPFSVFDKQTARYADLTIPPIAVRVTVGDLFTDRLPSDESLDESQSERPPALSQVSISPGKSVAGLKPLQWKTWFVAVQLAPACGFLGLWIWDRRRRFLEAHPEIVRRRQARRELKRRKRALQQAFARGDAGSFVGQAVAALQIGAAPHFPAAPRALVCGEVLSLFDDAERQGRTGEVIQSFFVADGSAQFGNGSESPASLLALRPDLEAVLMQMEARL